MIVTVALAGLVPGLPELLEDAAHVATSGHTLHADAHDPAQEPASEHGCRECAHCVQCHCYAPVSLLPDTVMVPDATQRDAGPAHARMANERAGIRRSVERPPRG